MLGLGTPRLNPVGAARASVEIDRRTARWEGEPFWEGERCSGRGSRQKWGMLARKEAQRSSGSRSPLPLRTEVNTNADMVSSSSAGGGDGLAMAAKHRRRGPGPQIQRWKEGEIVGSECSRG
jgi:hypothetical protein